MNGPCMEFCRNYLNPHEIKGKTVLDVGSCDVNGSFRALIEKHEPESYTGVDIEKASGVDEICNVENLIDRFGKNAFDIVVSAEMLEHVDNWKTAIHNIKSVCKIGGVILLTTRSYGFPYHGHPDDYWRFEIPDILHIFSDCNLLGIQSDYVSLGVMIKVRKNAKFKEIDLKDFNVRNVEGIITKC